MAGIAPQHVPASEVRIQSIARAKALLDAMAGGEWVSLRDLAQRTGLVKTTAFNLIKALVETGLAEHDAGTGSYRLGLQHIVYGNAVARRLDIVTIARPHLSALCARTRETINLAIPGPADAFIAESLEGSYNLRVSSYSGTRASYHSTACGRALLAYQPEAFRRLIYEVAPLQKLTPNTITDPEDLESVLQECRTKGWTQEFEENEPGSACIAAPIFGPGGNVVASVSIAGPASRFDDSAVTRLSDILVACLDGIARDLIDRS